VSERVIVLLISLIAGLLLCCLGGSLLTLTGSVPAAIDASAPADADIQADLSEAYLNRLFLENADTYPSPLPLEGGYLDIQPGNRIGFVAQVGSPAGKLTAKGTITIAVEDGALRIRLAEVRLGSMPVTTMMRLFQPALEANINALANRQLLERTGQAKVTLLAITTDDDEMHVFLAAKK